MWFMNMKYDFWIGWKNKTGLEIDAIEKVKLARDLVIKLVPKKALVSIYIKGSFVRREMKEGSDVDMVPIVSEYKYQGNVWEANVPEVQPVVIVPLSLDEFRDNKLYSKSDEYPDMRALPDRFLAKLNSFKLIYGQTFNLNDFPIRTDLEVLKDEIKIIRGGYLPAYEANKTKFFLKEVFWLVELELKVRGIKVEHSFQGILKAVKDKDHIIHQAFAFRLVNGTQSEKKAFIINLKKYLNYLDKIYF